MTSKGVSVPRPTDTFVVSNSPMPACVEILSPSAWSSNIPSDAVVKWRSSAGAKNYKIKIGTTQNGSEFLPLTDVGRDTFFKPAQKFGFLTTYFVTVTPYDSSGNARLCYPIQFSTQRNANFGGGVNGNDPGQPMSGGYFFANSTLRRRRHCLRNHATRGLTPSVIITQLSILGQQATAIMARLRCPILVSILVFLAQTIAPISMSTAMARCILAQPTPVQVRMNIFHLRLCPIILLPLVGWI